METGLKTEPTCGFPGVSLWQPVVFGAMAGGLGWGIRGQYGHETGAMIAGLLVALVLTLLFRPQAARLSAARAVAWATVAMGFGGSMTYGQTVGLTHDAQFVGNWHAFGWGMLGLAIKGGVWIGFAGAFLGLGLGGKRYRTGEMALVMMGLLGACALGIWLLNEPFDPAQRILPRVYFSSDWRWAPEAALEPRREVWGGLLAALVALLVYTGGVRRDPLAVRLGLWGMLGGATGFPLGGCVQAWHGWNLDSFRGGLLGTLGRDINWWNFMETTFGMVMGATLGLGLWLNRKRIARLDAASDVGLSVPIEWVVAGAHVFLLVAGEFTAWRFADTLYDFGLMLGFIPVVALAAGRWWPYLVIFPVTAVPIAGKTLQSLAYRGDAMSPLARVAVYVVVPLAVATAIAVWAGRRSAQRNEAGSFLRRALLFNTWLYFLLNFAVFRFPWPWETWTGRTPNAVVFAGCAFGLTWIAWHRCRQR